MSGYDGKGLYSDDGFMRLSVGNIDSDDDYSLMFTTIDNMVEIYKVKSGFYLERTTTTPGTLEKIDDAVGASFFDLDDRGHFSIIVESKNRSIRGFMTIPTEDNYVIKALAFQKMQFSQIRVGVCYQYIKTKVEGDEVLVAGHQLISNAYRTLQMPYMMNGLGRCQNYIEYLTFNNYPYVKVA